MVAMSGGVDSSVAMVKILEAGYDAVGITMKLWEYQTVGGEPASGNSCCGIEEINGAKLVCDQLGVPHYTLDFTQVFREQVVDNFASEYLGGRTPNPCVRCNSYVKWDAFIDQADQMGINFIATGHYARVEHRNGKYFLKKGKDLVEDQSYVLWGIPRKTLKRTIFPLGNLTKKEVRKIAEEYNLPTANAPESMEICFVADNNYRRFLEDYKPEEMAEIPEGVIEENGISIGSHPGYTHYTIGQRKGLKLSNPEPRYVTGINPKTNTVQVGLKESLMKTNCKIDQANFLVKDLNFPKNITAMIRYNSMGGNATLTNENGGFKLEFDTPQMAITPGQSAVFYDGDIVIGGGIIELNS